MTLTFVHEEHVLAGVIDDLAWLELGNASRQFLRRLSVAVPVMSRCLQNILRVEHVSCAFVLVLVLHRH